MAAQTNATQAKRSRTRTARNGGGDASAARRSASRARRSASTEVRKLERMIRSLENRIATLTSEQGIRSTVSAATGQVGRAMTGATDQFGDLVADALTGVADRLRGGATAVTGAARTGTGLVRKVSTEMERRPMMTVALALGIGFLAGLAGKRADLS